MANFWEGVGNFFSGIGNGIKDVACTVGNFVKDTVVDVGKGAFNFVADLPGHIADAWKDGTSRISEGIEQMKNGAGFSGFVNVLGGAVHAVTPVGWTVDTFNDVALENTDLVTDELGNSAYVSNGKASNGLLSGMFRNFVNTDRRTQESISDALETGDAKSANLATLGQVGATGTQVLAQAAMVGSFATGVGAPLGIALGASSAGLNMASTYIDDSMKKADLEGDIDRAVAKGVKELTESGALSAESKDEYAEYLTKFYNTTSVNGLGQVGAMSKEDFDVLAAGNGLLDMTSGGTEVSAYPDGASGAGNYDIYAGYYDQMVRDGSLSPDQADRLSMLGAMYDDGQLDQETYFANMHLIQYENYDLTEDQAMTLAVMDAYVDMGEITQEEHAQLLRSEPVFDSLRQPDGSLYAAMRPEAAERAAQGNALESLIEQRGEQKDAAAFGGSVPGPASAAPMPAVQREADDDAFSLT